MSQNISERLMIKWLERSNYKLIDIPVAKGEENKILAVDSNNFTTLMDPQTGQTYQMPKSVTGAPNRLTNTSSSVSNPDAIEISKDGILQKWFDGLPRLRTLKSHCSNTGSSYSTTVHPDAMDIDSPSQSRSQVQPSCPSGKFPKTRSKITEGLHWVCPEEYAKLCHPLPSPTRLDADFQFADSLYLSMQNDILPRGANSLDDYLQNHRDIRMAIYLSAALDNQGWLDQHCDLDKYLLRHKDNLSVIALRATLSDECKLNVRDPVKSVPVCDVYKIVTAQLERLQKSMKEANNPISDTTSPWTSMTDNEEEMRIG